MEIHRVLIAVALSLVVLLVWNFLFPPAPPQRTMTEQQETRQQTQSPDTAEQNQISPEPAPDEIQDFQPVEGRQISVETPLYKAVFNTSGGILEHFVLKQYKQTIEPGSPAIDLITPRSLRLGPMGLAWNGDPTWTQAEWAFEGRDLNLSAGQEDTLTFTGRMPGLDIVRTITFRADTYEMSQEVQLINTTQAQLAGNMANVLATPPFSDDRYNPTRMVYFDQSGLTHEKDKALREGLEPQAPVQWSGVGNHYFLLAFVPDQSMDSRLQAVMKDGIFHISTGSDVLIEPGGGLTLSSTYYIGPKDRDHLKNAPGQLEKAIYYGWFNVIAKPLVLLLNYLQEFTKNYGAAILVLTLIIKLLFWPLSQKSYKSMNQLKKLQPMMAKIREKYKDDRQKMNEEMMRLYKTYKVNPAGGCLPILVQIPVFIALYQGLLGSVELRHAEFIYYLPFTDIIWLADLSAKDPLYITPLVMGATMFLQQKMSPPPGDPMQAKLMMFLPLIFIFIFISFPAGLVLYWLTNNVLSIGQQWWVLKKAGPAPTAATDQKTAEKDQPVPAGKTGRKKKKKKT